jgi:hypothetical protein
MEAKAVSALLQRKGKVWIWAAAGIPGTFEGGRCRPPAWKLNRDMVAHGLGKSWMWFRATADFLRGWPTAAWGGIFLAGSLNI